MEDSRVKGIAFLYMKLKWVGIQQIAISMYRKTNQPKQSSFGDNSENVYVVSCKVESYIIHILRLKCFLLDGEGKAFQFCLFWKQQ